MKTTGAYHPLTRSLVIHTADCTNFLMRKKEVLWKIIKELNI
nr:MAG TPA: hypothetical protein [Caudoviricetes sp.]